MRRWRRCKIVKKKNGRLHNRGAHRSENIGDVFMSRYFAISVSKKQFLIS